MDFTKHYILQAIGLATNNLRLSPDRIETVTLLKDYLQNSESLKDEISLLKTKTELSKFGIKLGEAYRYIDDINVDFLKLSDKFKEHSNNLIIELSNVLDQVNIEQLRSILFPPKEEEISIDLGAATAVKKFPEETIERIFEDEDKQPKELEERDSLKEEIILEEVKEQNKFDFDDFEQTILKPVSKLEQLLRDLHNKKVSDEEISKFITIMKKNCKLSEKIGFNILSDMHKIFYTALENIQSREIKTDTKLIESMRACLIVIVAIVRSKDVEITAYINRAEKLGNF